MSDGTINFPVRVSHPDIPAAGRVKFYTFDTGSAEEPYYMLDTGVFSSLIGPQGNPGNDGVDGNRWFDGSGAPGGGLGNDDDYYLDTDNGDVYQKQLGSWGVVGNIEGPQGPQGNDGPIGPAGPMNVEAFISETGTVTLPNSTTKQVVYTDSVTIGSTGDCFLDVSLAVKPHSTNNDMEFDILFDGNLINPIYAEEGKDQSNPASNWRSQCFSLGNVAAGTYDLDLRFSKETTGGTAQLKNYTAKVVRYS